jgi:hypothetical protein
MKWQATERHNNMPRSQEIRLQHECLGENDDKGISFADAPKPSRIPVSW